MHHILDSYHHPKRKNHKKRCYTVDFYPHHTALLNKSFLARSRTPIFASKTLQIFLTNGLPVSVTNNPSDESMIKPSISISRNLFLVSSRETDANKSPATLPWHAMSRIHCLIRKSSSDWRWPFHTARSPSSTRDE